MFKKLTHNRVSCFSTTAVAIDSSLTFSCSCTDVNKPQLPAAAEYQLLCSQSHSIQRMLSMKLHLCSCCRVFHRNMEEVEANVQELAPVAVKRDFRSNLMCSLCNGYVIDAHTLSFCMHTCKNPLMNIEVLNEIR